MTATAAKLVRAAAKFILDCTHARTHIELENAISKLRAVLSEVCSER